MVLQSAPGLQNHQHAVLPKSTESDGAATPMVDTAGDEGGASDHNAAGVAVLLFPPASRRNWTVRGIFLTIKLWVLDIFDPVPEEGTSPQVPNHPATFPLSMDANSNAASFREWRR
jgi:hypothetical protein